MLCCSSKLGVKKVYDWMVCPLQELSQIYCQIHVLPSIYVMYNVSCVSMFCSVVLFPVAVTFFITWWFIQFVDGFFSPLYAKLGINIFGKSYAYVFSSLVMVYVVLHKGIFWSGDLFTYVIQAL